MNALKRDDLILITGGNGFIGSHVAARLHGLGHRVRIVDIQPSPLFGPVMCSEMMIGDLCDPAVCRRAVCGVKLVLHFAAVMGGMGVIHSSNDVPIYVKNHTMTMHLVTAAIDEGVKCLFFASTACVYPDHLLDVDGKDVSFRESDVWANGEPHPQGLYGMDKLASEEFLRELGRSGKLSVRIARFHNVYGPGGAWNDGREKAPAAMARKAIAAKLANEVPLKLEVWGDGTQRRSFLWIDDAVDAVMTLLQSDCIDPVNIGSDQAISIEHLARLALSCAGLDPADVRLVYDSSKPIGVPARNSNNDFVKARLGWHPRTSLADGMAELSRWMETQIDRDIASYTGSERVDRLQQLQQSQVINLANNITTFALIVPITSRGSSDCLADLKTFAHSIIRTTWRDTHPSSGSPYHVRIYLAIDHDDQFLLDGSKAEVVLKEAGSKDVTTIICHQPRGHVCALWRDCAQRGWEDGCDYFVLMGDDVEVLDEGWMRAVEEEFHDMAVHDNGPASLGCVAFTDITFPGMPTFPVVHRTHLDIFQGEVVPPTFINQDGDPYLFQLYRRWGRSRMMQHRIRNYIGGSVQARYDKKPASGWTFRPLDAGTQKVETWLSTRRDRLEKKLTLDVIVPCFRVQLPLLDRILQLQPSPTSTVMFIIIVDNPASPHIFELESKYGHRPDVRIRVHKENLGASAARNRGLWEASAEWVHFLDDDVVPEPNLLVESEKAIRAHPEAAGFVGNVQFPPADTVATAAIHLSGATYFWDIATKIAEDVPWGVTASLIARRSVLGKEDVDIRFDPCFPKTGGGEDIDYCLKKRRACVERGGEGLRAAPNVVVTHPWWYNGRRSYWRFFGWAKGDGALIKMWPEHAYTCWMPNSGEALVFSVGALVLGVLVGTVLGTAGPALLGINMVLSAVAAGMIHDLYRHLWLHPERNETGQHRIRGWKWILAVMESTIVRMMSEVGRVVGMIQRKEFSQLGQRFDWFTMRFGNGPREEEAKTERETAALWVLLTAIMYLHHSM